MISYKFKFVGFDERQSAALLVDKLVNRGYLFSTTIYPTICHIEKENKLFAKSLTNSIKELNFEINKSYSDVKKNLDSFGYLERGFSRTQTL